MASETGPPSSDGRHHFDTAWELTADDEVIDLTVVDVRDAPAPSAPSAPTVSDDGRYAVPWAMPGD